MKITEDDECEWLAEPGVTVPSFDDATCYSVEWAVSNRRIVPDNAMLQILDNAKKPRDGGVYLDWSEALFEISRDTALAKEQCLIRLPGSDCWMGTEYNVNGTTCVKGMADARRMVDHYGTGRDGSSWLFYPLVVNSALPLQTMNPAKRCEIHHVLSPPVIHLLTNSPQNSAVRAMVRNELNRKLPDELIAFDEIKNWIELNIKWNGKYKQGTVEPAASAVNVRSLTIQLDLKDTEYGRRHYTATRRGSYTKAFTANAIIQEVANVTGLEQAVDRFISMTRAEVEEIRDLSLNTLIMHFEDSDVVYGSYGEDTDSEFENFECKFNPRYRADIKQQLIDFLMATAPREELLRLGLSS
jgi:hypothetical protein